MPIILEWTFQDGTTEIERIPVGIWRKNENTVSKVFVKSKPVKSVKVDPFRETADINERNNAQPMPATPKLFKIYKGHREEEKPNPMQQAKNKNAKRP